MQTITLDRPSSTGLAAKCAAGDCTYHCHYLRRGAAELPHGTYHVREQELAAVNAELAAQEDAGTPEWQQLGLLRQVVKLGEVLRV